MPAILRRKRGRVKGNGKRFWLQIATEFTEKSFADNKLCQKPAWNSGLDQVVDLTDSTQQRIIRTNQSELTGNWVNYAGVSPTQHLGEALYHLPDLVGFLFVSSKVPANCLAIFPDKLSARSSVTFDNEMRGRIERMN